jgi:hypothetical protein
MFLSILLLFFYAAGFGNRDISVLFPQSACAKDFAAAERTAEQIP